MRSLSILVLFFQTVALPALAGDGVLEINQTCALNTGCFAGDNAGLPVTIDGGAGHSYRLTSDLVVPNENTDGIQVSTDNVSIDLAGFEIRGVVVCSGVPLACAPNSGTGTGVERTLGTLSGISVRNGSVRGMGNYGVFLGTQSEVTNVRVRSNRIDGIFADNGSTVSGNTAYQNGDNGIYTFSGSTVSGNTAYLNGNDGITASSGSTVSGNTAYDNDGDGIQAFSGAAVFGNTVRLNSGYGLNLLTDSAYRDNVVTNNTTGTVTGAGSANSRGGNYCAGTGVVSAFCP